MPPGAGSGTDFRRWGQGGKRLVLLTTRGAMAYADFAFQASDTLLVGRESAGVPDEVHAAADARLVIPMQPGPALPECGPGGGDGAGRGAAPDRPFSTGGMMELTLFQPGGLIALLQVLMIDVVLAGDNAVVIGMAAARVPPRLRKKVIFWGLIAAVVPAHRAWRWWR